jgi:hypothetical protein
MNLDDPDLLPVGGGSLRGPASPPVHEPVARFTPTKNVDPSEIWPAGTRPTTMSRGGSQGDPYGSYRAGGSIQDEPVTRNERDAQHTAQNAAHFVAAGQVRAALRGGI